MKSNRPKFAPRRRARWALGCLALMLAGTAHAQHEAREAELLEAAALLRDLAARDADAIPAELLERAHGIAVIPNVLRGGFIFGARRGRGVLAVRTPSGAWSNPAFITLTGGSIGWQFGAESTDLVLVFANAASVRNMASGKFTLGGDASAVAGPLGRHSTLAVTFRAEVYSYIRSQGLFAGAAFEGARLAIDDEANRTFYSGVAGARALGEQAAGVPAGARRFLLSLEEAAVTRGAPARRDSTSEADVAPDAEAEEAVIYPLE